LDGGWLNYPRRKTKVYRRIPLWPETVESLREALPLRPSPKDEADADLCFVTKYGNRWVRMKMTDEEMQLAVPVDSVRLEFDKLLRKLGFKRPKISFYVLRHVFETVAGESRDQVAVDAVMGHTRDDMAGLYRERISDERLIAVVETVRRWLWPEGGEDPMML
jgi:integrase